MYLVNWRVIYQFDHWLAIKGFFGRVTVIDGNCVIAVIGVAQLGD